MMYANSLKATKDNMNPDASIDCFFSDNASQDIN